MPPSAVASGQVRAWTRAALAAESGETPAADESAETSANLAAAIARHRVGDLLAAQADVLPLPAELAAELARARAARRRHVLLQSLEIAELRRLLDSAGVDSLVLKGLALAVQTTGDPAARGPGDIDLLVAPGQVERTHRILVAHGLAPRSPVPGEPGTWAWRYLIRTFCALTYDGPGTSVDLHWRLDPSLDGLPGFAELWDRREYVDLAGVPTPTLGRRDALAHACLHASKDHWRSLRSLVDVHRLAEDPVVWKGEQDPRSLHRLEVSTLAVTRAQVGLPAAVPAEVLRLLDGVGGRTLARAERNQDRPEVATAPFPGVESARNLGYLVRASRSPANLLNTATAMLLPVESVLGVRSRTALTGVPVSIGRRLARMLRRARAWWARPREQR